MRKGVQSAHGTVSSPGCRGRGGHEGGGPVVVGGGGLPCLPARRAAGPLCGARAWACRPRRPQGRPQGNACPLTPAPTARSGKGTDGEYPTRPCAMGAMGQGTGACKPASALVKQVVSFWQQAFSVSAGRDQGCKTELRSGSGPCSRLAPVAFCPALACPALLAALLQAPCLICIAKRANDVGWLGRKIAVPK